MSWAMDRRAAPAGGMAGVTGVPLAIGLQLLAEGRVKEPGVVAPEAALDPDTFFDALAPYCEPPKAGHAEVVLVTRSWETPP